MHAHARTKPEIGRVPIGKSEMTFPGKPPFSPLIASHSRQAESLPGSLLLVVWSLRREPACAENAVAGFPFDEVC